MTSTSTQRWKMNEYNVFFFNWRLNHPSFIYIYLSVLIAGHLFKQPQHQLHPIFARNRWRTTVWGYLRGHRWENLFGPEPMLSAIVHFAGGRVSRLWPWLQGGTGQRCTQRFGILENYDQKIICQTTIQGQATNESNAYKFVCCINSVVSLQVFLHIYNSLDIVWFEQTKSITINGLHFKQMYHLNV